MIKILANQMLCISFLIKKKKTCIDFCLSLAIISDSPLETAIFHYDNLENRQYYWDQKASLTFLLVMWLVNFGKNILMSKSCYEDNSKVLRCIWLAISAVKVLAIISSTFTQFFFRVGPDYC